MYPLAIAIGDKSPLAVVPHGRDDTGDLIVQQEGGPVGHPGM